jgi:hypothetical protein
MDKICLQCHQKLSFLKAVRGELFCSSGHRELYLCAEATLAFERVAFFDNPSPDHAEEAAATEEQPDAAMAGPVLEDLPPHPTELTAALEDDPAPSPDPYGSEETAPGAIEPDEPVCISAAKPRRRFPIWVAPGIAAGLAILVVATLFLGPSRKSAHSLLPNVVQPLSAAEADANPSPVVNTPRRALPKTEAPPKTLPATKPSSQESLVGPSLRHTAAIRVTAASWVAACSDGKEVLSHVLANGDSREIEFSEKAIVRTGNAGGTEVSVDGRTMGSLGPAGALRIVELAPHEFHLLSLSPGDNGHDCRNN